MGLWRDGRLAFVAGRDRWDVIGRDSWEPAFRSIAATICIFRGITLTTPSSRQIIAHVHVTTSARRSTSSDSPHLRPYVSPSMRYQRPILLVQGGKYRYRSKEPN